MGLAELFILAVGLSMDAFAISICSGLTIRGGVLKKALVTGFYFGFFQAAMPLIGYIIGTRFADMIVAYDHWIAFALLSFLGGKMIVEALKKEGCADRECPAGSENRCADRECPGGKRPDAAGEAEVSVGPARMLPLAVATSIDALAVGISFAFLRVDIVPAVSFIGIMTFTISVAGVKIGREFGTKFKTKAEIAGGAILVLIGIKIMLEHLGVIAF